MFGKTLRARRRHAGLSQESLARKAGVDPKTIRGIESGRHMPRLSTVRLLADALELTGDAREDFCAGALPATADQVADRPAPVRVPAQLPGNVVSFTGRSAELAELDALLAGHDTAPRAVVISAVAGTAGVGKTALTVHWAHRVRHRFPDGQLYVNLRGFDAAGAVLRPAEAVRRFLDAFDVAPQRIPADLDAQVALYRTLLADRRVLVLLDNARDADQVRPLLPGAPGCLVLVNSRNQLTGLVAGEGAHPLALDRLSDDESRELLRRRIGTERAAAEPDAVDEIIRRCAGLPLALSIVAARAAVDRDLPLATLAAELRDSRALLDALSTGDLSTDVRAVFSWSYRTLTPDAARVFRLLGLHPSPDISAPAAASLAGLPVARIRTLFAELVRAHLVAEQRPGRYTLHDLLRVYAVDRADHQDADQQRRAATHRLLDHYLHSAHAADRLLHPVHDPLALTAPQPGVVPEQFADAGQALAWLTAEHPVMLAAVDHAAATGFDTHTWQLAWTLWTYLNRRGHWRDWVATSRAAALAAQRLGELPVEAVARRSIALANVRLGRLDEADTELRHALDLAVLTGDLVEQARIHMALPNVWERQGRYREALDDSRRALTLFQAAGDRGGQGVALNAIGWYHARLGEHEPALDACRQALALLQEVGNRRGLAATWDSLGYLHHRLGHHGEAVACYQRALDLFRDLGDRYKEAAALTAIGDIHHAAGKPADARDAWQSALPTLIDIGHPDADQVRAKLGV